MRELAPCSACSRHVYSGEDVCPFCGASCDTTVRPGAQTKMSGGLSRAAMHAARAALVIGAASAVGCSEPPENVDGSVSDASMVTDAPESMDADVPMDALADAVSDAGPDIDSGETDAGETDAGPDVDIPIYGGIFPDPRKRAIV